MYKISCTPTSWLTQFLVLGKITLTEFGVKQLKRYQFIKNEENREEISVSQYYVLSEEWDFFEKL